MIADEIFFFFLQLPSIMKDKHLYFIIFCGLCNEPPQFSKSPFPQTSQHILMI